MEPMLKLLTIDDEDIIRDSIAAYFEDCNFTVIEANGGAKGIEMFRQEKPDIVLTDLNMPEVDGFEVVKTITAESQLTPTIVISGAGMIEDSIRAIRNGAWDYITKPIVDMAELEHTVNKALERAQLLSENRKYQLHLEEKVIERTTELRELNENLEHKVEERTAELQESLDRLKQTQNQLVESEKMAALGGLVAGVAHEINTPVGIGVTAASHLEERTKKFSEIYKSGKLARSDFESFISVAQESSKMILSNMNRAADLIQSFKQVAVDQSSEEMRTFKVKEYVEEILMSLHPKFKSTNHEIILNCPEEFSLTSYPGALSQIITNFLMNSLKHGFEGVDSGKVTIDITKTDNTVHLLYQDTGKGIPKKNLNKIFDPFFTTKRGQGGSGLGMHIVYNLITQTLGGEIKCSSIEGEGTKFELTIPCNMESHR